MSKYFPQNFEEKWCKKWAEDGLFQHTYHSGGVTSENKMYLLYAFAYPSGSGLHVGHVEPVTALDILARYYRSIGKKVFFPVGWDAFGLPAENYAVKTGTPPAQTTKDAIENFSRQIKRIGVSYDWGAEIATSHPGYYQWTQWLFLQLYKKGLAYKQDAPVNWCPGCQTVLANEQVVKQVQSEKLKVKSFGRELQVCERCGTEVTQKKMEQWFFKITKYMDELISGLDKVDWPKATKQQQLNWIGKSEGAMVEFAFSHSEQSEESRKEMDPSDKPQDDSGYIEVFTTAHDTIYGATFMVLAPEHDLINEIVNGCHSELVSESQRKEVQKYVELSKTKTEEERLVNKEKTGVFSGLYAINPLTQKEIPIWIADYVLAQYGTGAIMAVPGSDERDYEFAKKFDLPIIYVVQKKTSKNEEFISFSKEVKVCPSQYTLINSGEFDGQDYVEGRENIMKKLEDMDVGKRETTYKLRDWLISRQRYWGTPIPIVYDPEGKAHPVKEEHLPWVLPTDVNFKPTGESPLRLSKEFKTRVERLYGAGWTPEYDTMDTFVDSSWYYLRYTDPRNTQEFAQTNVLKKWMPIDFYMIGPEHIVLHLLYSRFFTKFLRDEGYLSEDEPFMKMRHQGMILGPDNRKMSKSKGNVINPDDVIAEYGADTLRMYEMFLGPIDADKPWSVESVQGQYRFLKRVWKLFNQFKVQTNSKLHNANTPLTQLLHQTIQKVGSDIEKLKFNTAIAAMMEFLNVWEKTCHPEVKPKDPKKDMDSSVVAKAPTQNDTVLSTEDAKKFLKILSPFAPFITEEIWHEILGESSSIHTEAWPQVDESLLQLSTVTIPVQINGKMRGRVEINVNDTEDDIIDLVLKNESLAQYVSDRKYKKAIYVKGKILNIIV